MDRSKIGNRLFTCKLLDDLNYWFVQLYFKRDNPDRLDHLTKWLSRAEMFIEYHKLPKDSELCNAVEKVKLEFNK